MDTGLAQRVQGLLQDAPGNLVGVGRSIDLPPPLRFLGRHLQVPRMHPLVEGDGFPVEPVLRVARNSRQPCFHGKIQQERPIGRKASGGFRLQPPQGLEVQPAAETLIRKG